MFYMYIFFHKYENMHLNLLISQVSGSLFFSLEMKIMNLPLDYKQRWKTCNCI